MDAAGGERQIYRISHALGDGDARAVMRHHANVISAATAGWQHSPGAGKEAFLTCFHLRTNTEYLSGNYANVAVRRRLGDFGASLPIALCPTTRQKLAPV